MVFLCRWVWRVESIFQTRGKTTFVLFLKLHLWLHVEIKLQEYFQNTAAAAPIYRIKPQKTLKRQQFHRSSLKAASFNEFSRFFS